MENYETYEARTEIHDIDDVRVYKLKMAVLLSLRIARMDLQDAWIGFNVKEGRDFGDLIVYTIDRKNNDAMYLVQFEYQVDPKTITRDELLSENPSHNFNLKKCVSTYDDIKNTAENVSEKWFVDYLKNTKATKIVLYTNRCVSDVDFLEKIACTEDLFSTGDKGCICSFLKNVLEDKSLFLENLQLHAQQANVTCLDTDIIKEIKKLPLPSELSFETVIKQYISYIDAWTKGDYNGHYLLTRARILSKLTELFLVPFVDSIQTDVEQIKVNDNIWNKAIKNNQIVIAGYSAISEGFLRQFIKQRIVQIFNRKESLQNLLTLEDLDVLQKQHPNILYEVDNTSFKECTVTLQDVYISLSKLKQIPLLLNANSRDEYQYIMHILRLSGFRFQVIIINRCSLFFGHIIFTPRPINTLMDLDEEVRNLILQRSVIKQGSLVPLKDIVKKNDDLLRSLEISQVIEIILGSFNIDTFKPRSY